MGKSKGGRGARVSRYGGGRDGRKQSAFNPTLDTEMLDAPRRRSERYMQHQKESFSSRTQLESEGRGRLGKATRDTCQTQQSIFNNTLLQGQQSSATRANPTASAFSSHNPFVSWKSHRASIGTCVSALSTTRVGRGPYCYRCAHTNRKLRQALLDLLESALKDGKKLIDEWAWEAGVSPDHMDCERTKMHIVPEGLQSENEPCHRCRAGVWSRDQNRRMSTSRPAIKTSQAPGSSVLGPQLRPAGIHGPLFSQPLQSLNPFTQVACGAPESQPSPTLTSQVPRARPWTLSSAMMAAEQTVTDTCNVGYPDSRSQLQAQQTPYQQQQQESGSGHIWQAVNELHNNPTHEQPDQVHPHPTVDRFIEQATLDPYISKSVSQEYQWGHPYKAIQKVASFVQASSVQVPQVHQYQFQHLQHLLGGGLEHPGSVLVKPVPPAHQEDQSRQDALITPPPPHEMTIIGMLNKKDSATGEEASSETMHQATGKSSGDVLSPNPGQGQPPQSIAPDQEPERELELPQKHV